MKWRWKFGKWNIRKKYIQCFSKSCIIHPASEELGIYIHQQRKTAEGIVCKYPISGLKSRSVCRGEVVQSRFCSAGSFGTQIFIPLYLYSTIFHLWLPDALTSLWTFQACACAATERPCFAASVACPCLSLHFGRTASWRHQRYRPVGGAFSQAKPKAVVLQIAFICLMTTSYVLRSRPCFHGFRSTLQAYMILMILMIVDSHSSSMIWICTPSISFPFCSVWPLDYHATSLARNWIKIAATTCSGIKIIKSVMLEHALWKNNYRRTLSSRDPKWQQQLNTPVLILQGRSAFWWAATMLQSFHKTMKAPWWLL